MFQSLYATIITNLRKSLWKGSGWIIDSAIDHSISKYNSLAGSSYTKLTKEFDHPKNGLINIQSIDGNECFKWCLAKYLNPVNYHSARISKAHKDLAKMLDFVDISFAVKIRDIHKIKNKNSLSISVFAYENKEKYPIYVSKKSCEEKHVDLLLIGEAEKKTLCSHEWFQ